jgi:hypothetical protein
VTPSYNAAVGSPSDWRSARDVLSSEAGTDIVSRLEAEGADPRIVAAYLRLWQAIHGELHQTSSRHYWDELLEDRGLG